MKNWNHMNNKVICKVPQLGGEFDKFDPSRAQNQQEGLNCLQTKLTRSKTRFCTDFGA
jgi:hypothetical protein